MPEESFEEQAKREINEERQKVFIMAYKRIIEKEGQVERATEKIARIRKSVEEAEKSGARCPDYYID